MQTECNSQRKAEGSCLALLRFPSAGICNPCVTLLWICNPLKQLHIVFFWNKQLTVLRVEKSLFTSQKTLCSNRNQSFLILLPAVTDLRQIIFFDLKNNA